MYNYANSLVYTDDLLLLIVKIKQTKLSCVSFAKKIYIKILQILIFSWSGFTQQFVRQTLRHKVSKMGIFLYFSGLYASLSIRVASLTSVNRNIMYTHFSSGIGSHRNCCFVT